jgi:hypothetical protein
VGETLAILLHLFLIHYDLKDVAFDHLHKVILKTSLHKVSNIPIFANFVSRTFSLGTVVVSNVSVISAAEFVQLLIMDATILTE